MSKLKIRGKGLLLVLFMLSSSGSIFAQCANIFQFTFNSSPATCLNADGGIGVVNVTGGTGNYTFSLLGGPFVGPSLPPNNHAFTALSAGVYSFTISDGTCDTTVSVTIPLTGGVTSASATVTPTSCTGNTGSIVVSQQPASVNVVSYTINTAPSVSNTTGIFSNLPAGNYSITLVDANGCPFTINSIKVKAQLPPTDMDIEITPIQCKGAFGSIKVNGVTGGTAPYKYSLNGSAPTGVTTFENLFQGVYTVTVFDNNNCSYSESVQMTGSTTELKDCDAGKDVTVFFGENVQLNAIKGIGNKFSWSPGSILSDSTLLNPIAFPTATTTLVFTTRNSEGCTCKDLVTIRVIPLMKIPNTFTPNGDGVNDIWIIENTQLYNNVELNVYNRWGDKVYYVSDYKTGNEWDGGSLPSATYYYVLRFNYPGQDERFEYTGGITIVR